MLVKIKDKKEALKIIDNACDCYKRVYNKYKPKFLKLDEWLDKESSIFENETLNNNGEFPKFKRGEIIKVDFGINIGSELSQTHFAIVLNGDDTINNDNITVVPITSKNGYKRVALGKILKQVIPNTKRYNLDCYAFITQIKTISKKRIFNDNLEKYVCNDKILDKLDIAIREYLTHN